MLRAIEPTNSNTGHDWFHRHLLTYGIERAEHELDWAAASAVRCDEARSDSRGARTPLLAATAMARDRPAGPAAT